MEELHYFSFSFTHSDETNFTTGSVYIGFPDKVINKARIEGAKMASGMHKGSVLIAVCYLGHMTNATFLKNI